MAGLDKYGKQPHMIQIEKTVTSKNCPWSSKNLAGMLPYNEVASRHETLWCCMRRVNKFAAISTFNMTCTLHKNSIFYKKQKKMFLKKDILQKQ